MTQEQRLARQKKELEADIRRSIVGGESFHIKAIEDKNVSWMIPDKAAFTRNIAVASWMDKVNGKDNIPGAPDWQANKDAIASVYLKQDADGITDEEFANLVGSHLTTQATVIEEAFNSAARDIPLADALASVQDKAGLRAPGKFAAKAGEHLTEFTRVYQQTKAKLYPYRFQINTLAEVGRDIDKALEKTVGMMTAQKPMQPVEKAMRGRLKTGVMMNESVYSDMAELLYGVPEEDRDMVIEAVASLGAKPGKTQRDAFTRLVISFDRGLSHLLSSGYEGLVQIGRRANKAMSSEAGYRRDQEKGFELTDEEEKRRNDLIYLQGKMRNLSTRTLDPIDRVELLGMSLSGAAENLPMMVGSFVPYVGPALMLGQFKADTKQSMREKYPELTEDQLDAFSLVAAPFQAASEVISNRLLFGRLPSLGRLINAPAFTRGAIAKQLAGRLVIGTGVEYTEELFQQAFPEMLVDLTNALTDDVPDVRWDNFWRDWTANQGELIATIIPLVLLGSGVGQFSDFQNSRALARDTDMLIAAGYSSENATKIKEFADAGQWAEAQSLMLSDWRSVNAKGVSIGAVGNEAANKILEERRAAREAVLGKLKQFQEDAAKIADRAGYRMQKVSGGWKVTTPQAEVTVGTAEEATALLQEHYSANEKESILAIARMADALEATDTADIQPGTVQQITWKDNKEAVEIAARMAGLTPEQAQKMVFNILGESTFEFADGVKRSVARVFAGGNVLTMVEESIEGKTKKMLANGSLTREEAVAMVTLAEQVVNEGRAEKQVIFDRQSADQDRALIEAISRVVVLDVLGRRKEGGKVAPGVVSRGMAAHIRAGRENAKAAGMLSSFTKAWRQYFQPIFQSALAIKKARAEGKLGEDYDAFINKLLGVDAALAEQEATIEQARQIASEMRGLEGQPYTYSMLAGMPQSVGSDFFSEAGKFYRVIVGQAAFNDIVESGQVRTNAEDKAEGAASLADKLKARPTAFPSFSKDQAAMEYAAENPEHFIVVSTDPSLAPSRAGRHGKGTTYFPTDTEGNHLKAMSAENTVVYRHDGDGQYSKVYEGAKVNQLHTYSLRAEDVRSNAEYLGLVQGGDSGTDNLGALVKAAPAAERANVIEQWTQRNPKAVAELQRMVDEAAKAAGGIRSLHGTPASQLIDAENQIKPGASKYIFTTPHRGKANVYSKMKRTLGDAATPKVYEVFVFIKNPASSISEMTEENDGFIEDQGQGIQYEGVRNSNQIKSADPITLDKQGNVIPLSQRFDATKPEITYSLRAEDVRSNAGYLRLVEGGDSGTDNLGALVKAAPAEDRASVIKQWTQRNPQSAAELQRLVDQAARVAGYDVDLTMFHGTTHEFDVFTKDKSNVANDFGKGFYFTTSEEDISENYAGVGPDLEYRIEREAKRLARNENMPFEEAIEKVRKRLVGDSVRAISAYLKFENPVRIGGNNETFLDFKQSYNEKNDEYSEPEGVLVDFIEALRVVADRYDNADSKDAESAIMKVAMNDGGIGASKLVEILGGEKGLAYTQDKNGSLAVGEIIREAFELSGFDAIEDFTVGEKFKMAGVNEDTIHKIAFESSQIKSADPITLDKQGNVIPLSQRFDATKPEITYSLRAQPASTENVIEMPDGARLIGPTTFSIRAYHGTPHKIPVEEGFRMEKIGTGQGEQAYGHGLYFAGERNVAEGYRINLAYDPDKMKINGKQINDEYSRVEKQANTGSGTFWLYEIMDGLERLMTHESPSQVIRYGEESGWDKRSLDYFKKAKFETFGNLYTVDLLPDEANFLDWDKPLSEQSEGVKDVASELMSQVATSTRDALLSLEEKQRQEAIRLGFNRKAIDIDTSINMQLEEATSSGAGFYSLVKGLQRQQTPEENAKAASEFLASRGIPGIKYLDDGSRSTGEGSRNYVIFDDKLVKILEENGQPVSQQTGGTYSLQPSFEDRLTSVFSPLMRDPAVRRELATRALDKAKSEAAKLGQLKGSKLTPAEQKDRTVQGLRTLNAALAAMPPLVRTRVGGFIAVAQRSTPEGMMREIERRVAKMDRELERYLAEEATTDAEKLFDRYKSQRDSGGRMAGKLLSDATEQVDFALSIYGMEEAQQDMTIGGLQKRVDEAENADDLQDAMNKLAIAELFSHWGNMDSEARFAAVDWMRDIIDAGKLGRSIIDEERKQFIAALKEDARESVLGDVRASLAKAENKDNQMDSNAWQTFVRNVKSAGGSLLWTTAQQLELLFGADSRVYSYFTEKIIEAANLSTDIKTDADKRRVAFMQQLFETKSAFKLAQAMARLQKARNSGVFVNVGRVVDKVKIPVDVLERLSDGTVKPEDLGLNDAQAEQALEAFAAAGPMKRQIEIEKVVNAGELVEKFMSEGQGIMWFLWSRQDVSRKQMERDGWTEESFKQLDAFLSDEAKAIADFIAQDLQLAGDMIDPVYRRLFNAPMPRNKNYAPIYRLKPADTAAMDFESGMSSGLDAGFTKARVNNSLPLREMDAFVVFLSHWEHVSHWVSHAELMRDMKSVMFDANVQNSIRVKSGKGALEGINNRLKAIETNGNRAAWDLQSVNKLWSNLTKFRAFKSLAFRVSPVVKQTSAFLNPLLADVPAHAYAIGLANAFGDPVGFSSDVAAMWQSPIIQRRLEGGFSPEARIAMGRSGVTESTLIAAMQKGMAPMALTDAGWTTLGAAISFRYYKRMALREEGTTEEQANAMAMKRVERMIATSAQPADLVNRALMENSSSPIVKSLWMFASESRKSLAIELMAMRNLTKGKEVGMNVQRILVAHFVQAAVTQLMGSFLMSIMGDDEDKERAWSMDTWALSLALGPINGLFVLGSVIDTAARRAAGMYTFQTELLPGQVYSVTERAIRNIDDLFQDDPDSVLDEVDKLSSAIGAVMSTIFGPAGGAADVFLNIGRDVRKIYKAQAEE